MENRQSPSVKVVLLVTCIVFFLVGQGCNSTYSIVAKSEAKTRIKDFKISDGNNEFTFGVLTEGGVKGFMNANTTFGRQPPDALDVSFMVGNETTIKERRVIIPTLGPDRQIEVIINPDFSVSAQSN